MKKQTVDLGGIWDIHSLDGEYTLTGKVPGSLMEELENIGAFNGGDIFYRDNNRKAISMADRDFEYSRTFTVPDGWFPDQDKSPVFLEADGLDTLAEIRINGKFAARAMNMHRRYRIPVSSFLKGGENSISILFFNTLDYIRKERSRRLLWKGGDNGITTVEGFEMIRKSHCSYGWDWGPKVPDAGIWRDIRLCKYETARLETPHITQVHRDGSVELSISGDLERYTEEKLAVRCIITDPGGKEIFRNSSAIPPDKASYSLSAEIRHPRLWWPNGLGAQPLYTVEIVLEDAGGETVDRTEKQIGLRTLTIEQLPDQWGETFHFSINGQSVFSRGANYIPEDVFLTRTTLEKRERLISDCAAANFNTIRVWGGGVYPDDSFYDLCDRYGLIIWQDLMFSCAVYDVKEESFVENITREIEDNLTRIRHHPSIGLICGNNEMEWAFVEWENFIHTKEQEFEYLNQYHIIIPEIHKRICPEIFYWPSSPSSTGYFDNPNDPDRGDCHYWDVWHNNKDFSEYKKHYFRFMSEFGFESLPSIETIRSFTDKEDRNLFSPVMEEHQKMIRGNEKIISYLSKYFRYPASLENLAYVSQLSQAEAVKAGVHHWRRSRGRCMGSLYWQLNDNWPVASWSSIDYYGRWKVLHYEARRSFHNILLSVDGDEGSCRVHLSNEFFNKIEGLFSIRMLEMDSGKIVYEGGKTVHADPFSSEMIHEIPGDIIENLSGSEKRNIMVSINFKDAESGESFRAFHYFEPWKYLDLPDPELEYRLKKGSDGRTILVSAKRAALYVELKGGDRIFSDNYFDMEPGEVREINVYRGSDIDGDVPSITIRSLRDSYSNG